MTLTELRQSYDSMGAFVNFIPVSHAKAYDIIPSYAAEYFPDICECGSEMIINRTSRAGLQCCNPFCRIKQAYILSEMFGRFEIKGLGPSKAAKLLNEFERAQQAPLESYIDILMVEPDDYPTNVKYSELGDLLAMGRSFMKTRPITFAEMVGKLGLPALGGNAANTIFGKYTDINDFLADAKEVGSVQKLLVRKGVYDQNKLFWIAARLKDIGHANVFFADIIRQPGVTKLPICITGNVVLDGTKMTKKAFISLCNEASRTRDGVQLFEIEMNQAMNSNPFIIYSSESSSAKYLAGKQREMEAERLRSHGINVPKILVTPKEFMDYILGVVQEWETTHADLISDDTAQVPPKSTVLDITAFDDN